MIVHSILTHHPAAMADSMMQFLTTLGTKTRFCLAYGGARAEFDKIVFPDKLFLDHPTLRGPIEEQNFSCWLKATAKWTIDAKIATEAVHFSENDHLPLRKEYWDELDRCLTRSGKDFLGKWCMDRTNSNEAFFLSYRNNPSLLRHFESFSIHTDTTTIWGALADGMLIRWKALEALIQLNLEIACFTEILIPSSLHHLGFSLGDFDAYSSIFQWVRHRPDFTMEDLSERCAEGAWCCHPFKNVSKLPALYDLVLGLP